MVTAAIDLDGSLMGMHGRHAMKRGRDEPSIEESPAKLRAARPAARLLGIPVAVVLGASLAACSVNAGSAARDRFETAMEGVDGVVLAHGEFSNNLPFGGAGSLIVWLDATADRDVLVSAAERALTFEPGPGVNADIRSVVLGFGEGELSSLSGRYEQGISVEFQPGTEAGSAIDLMLEFDDDPDISTLLAESREVWLYLATGADACATVARVQQALGADVGEIDASTPEDGQLDLATCPGLG